MADSTLSLLIVVPEKTYFNGKVNSLSVVTSTGQITILPHHADLVANVEISLLILRQNGHVYHFSVGGGAVNVYQKENKVLLLVNSIEGIDEINLERAKLAKARAEEALANANSLREQQKAEIKLKRALNRIDIKNKYKNI